MRNINNRVKIFSRLESQKELEKDINDWLSGDGKHIGIHDIKFSTAIQSDTDTFGSELYSALIWYYYSC